MQFVGAQTACRDVRAEMSEQPYGYITDFSPSGVCPSKGDDCYVLPYTCGFSEGGKAISSSQIRVGAGLTRVRGGPRAQTQMVGPVPFQHGRGTIDKVDSRCGYRRQVRRGAPRPSTELKGCVPFQHGQYAFVGESTTQRGRNKYEYAVQTKSLSAIGQCKPLVVEPFHLGGVSTRDGKDFECV